MKSATKPTIRGIANDLGLSSATVSKALAGRQEINDETREKVMARAREVGYTKNLSTRRRFGAVAVNPSSMEDSQTSLLFSLLMGFQLYASKLSHDVVIINMNSEEQEQTSLDQFAYDCQLDGLFIAGLRNTDIYHSQLEMAITPIVVMDIQSANTKVGSVSTDSIKGGVLAIQHLSELGHKRIGFVNGHKEAYISTERLAGYISALHMYQIPFDQSLCFDGDYSIESGAAAADYFAKTDATAIYFASDLMALGAIRRFEALGFSLPHDFSIVGFDNLSICMGCSPTITTVAQDPVALGEAACAVLHGLEQGMPLRHVKLAPWLVDRESTAVLEVLCGA